MFTWPDKVAPLSYYGLASATLPREAPMECRKSNDNDNDNNNNNNSISISSYDNKDTNNNA